MAEVQVATGISPTDWYIPGGACRKVAFVNDKYYVFYTDSYDVWYTKSSDYGANWDTPVQMNTDTSYQYGVGIDVVGDVIHAVWHETSTDKFYHRTLDTSTDTMGTEHAGPSTLGWDTTGVNYVAVDSGGRIYVMNTSDPDVYYSDNGGVNWTSINDGDLWANENGRMICIGTSLHVLQMDTTNYDVEEMIYNGTSWSASPTVIHTYSSAISSTPPSSDLWYDGTYLYAMHVDYDITDGYYNIIHRKSSPTGTWTAEYGQMTTNIPGPQRFCQNLVEDTNSGLLYGFYVADDGSGYDSVFYETSSDNGATWENQTDAGAAKDGDERGWLSVTQPNPYRIGVAYVNTTDSVLYFLEAKELGNVYGNRAKANIVTTPTKDQSAQAELQPSGRIFTSGFELNSTSVEWNGIALATIDNTTYHGGSYALRCQDNGGNGVYAYHYLGVNETNGPTKYWARTYLRIAEYPSHKEPIFIVYGEAGNYGSWIELNTDGTLEAQDATRVSKGTSSVLELDRWYRIEMYGNLQQSSGSQDFKALIDGAPFVDISNATLGNGWVDTVYVGLNIEGQSTLTAGDLYFDDVAVNGDRGNDEQATGFPGPAKVIHLMPSGDGDNTTWSNGWANVDEIPPSTADSIYSDTAGEIEDMNVANTPSDVLSNSVINVVSVGAYWHGASGVGDSSFRIRLKATASGTVNEGSEITPDDTTYRTNDQKSGYIKPFITISKQPGTTNRWTKATLDTAQIGARTTTNTTSDAAEIATMWLSAEYRIPQETANNAKANIIVATPQANSAISNVQFITAKPSSAKANISKPGEQPIEAEANILVTDKTRNLSVKANLFYQYPQPSSAKANIKNTYSQANRPRADIIRFNETKNNSSKASIVKAGEAPIYAEGNILYIGDFKNNSSKANIVIEYTYDQSAKGFIAAFRPNLAKGNILVRNNTANNSVLARVVNRTIHDQSAKAFIEAKTVRKTYEYRVYDDNVYVTTWAKNVVSEPQFRTVINGGASELVVRIARTFDDFGEDEDIRLNNRVDLYCFDRDAPNGIIIYRGFISGYRPILEGNNEYIEITILSYIAETARIMLRDTDGATQYIQNSTDPTDILKNVIGRYRAYGGFADYEDSHIEDTNTTVSYTYETNTIKEAIDKVIELCPEGWYYFLDADAKYHLHPKSTVADHTFRVGREISELETWRRMEDIVNEVFFVGGGEPQMFRYYNNSGSIDAYGRGAVKKIDQRVTNTDTADTMSNRIINSKKDPEIRTRVVINDNNGTNPEYGYDIESIKVGDTFNLKNLKEGVKTITLWDIAKWDEDVWDQTLAYSATAAVQILSIDYSPDKVVLEASSRIPEISKRIEDINRNAEQGVLVNNPTSPTAA